MSQNKHNHDPNRGIIRFGPGETIWRPHLYPEGYAVSMTNLEDDYVNPRPQVEDPLIPYLKQGYSLRMSPEGIGRPQNLIAPSSIYIRADTLGDL